MERKLRQEAQLPLRNRASAMYFFVTKLISITIMTYTYVYHLRNLRRITFMPPETRVPELRDSCYSMGLSVFHFTKLYRKPRKDVQGERYRALSFNVFLLENPSKYPHKLYCQKLEFLQKIRAADNMSLSLIFINSYSIIFRKSQGRSQPKRARKQTLTQNNDSTSFKVMHFGITEKLTTESAYRYIITLASSLKFPIK